MSLNVSNSLTYAPPESIIDGKINYVSFKTQKKDYAPGETIDIKLSSNTDFLVPSRSYMKFNLLASTTGTLSVGGGSSCINSIVDSLSGSVLPIARNFHIKENIQLQTGTLERKAVDTFCQSSTFGSGTGLAVTSATNLSICIPFKASFDTDKVIPLALLNGWQQTYTLNSADKVLSAGTYTVRDFEIVACMLTPDENYMRELAQAMNAGQTLKIPIELYNNVTVPTTTALTQSILVNCGFYSSMNNVAFVHKESALANSTKVSDFFLLLDSQRFPKNKNIAGTVESFYQTLCGYSTELSSLSVPHTSQGFSYYSFKTNGDFSSGIPTANGFVSIEVSFNDAPSAGSVLETFITYDGILEVSRNGAVLHTDI